MERRCSIWIWYICAILLLWNAVIKGDDDDSKLIHCDLPILCNQSTSFYLASKNRTTFHFHFLDYTYSISSSSLQHQQENTSEKLLPQSFCIDLPTVSSFMYCAETNGRQNVILDLPFQIAGNLVEVNLLLHFEYHENSSNTPIKTSTVFKQSHYIKPYPSGQLPVFESYVSITSPTYGSLTEGVLDLHIDRFGEPFDQLVLRVHEVGNYLLGADIAWLKSPFDVEAGSWFFELVPMRAVSSPPNSDETNAASVTSWVEGQITFGYLEFVPSREELARERLFHDRADYQTLLNILSTPLNQVEASLEKTIAARYSTFRERSLSLATTKQQPMQDITNDSKERISVCFWSSNIMDGQKRIWLQQSAHLDHTRFAINWILSLGSSQTVNQELNKSREEIKGSVLSHLFGLNNVTLVDSPFNTLNIQPEQLLEIPADGGRPAIDSFDPNNHSTVSQYIHERFLAANGRLDQITPLWCKRIYENIESLLLHLSCDVVVFGNNRGYSTDFFITDVSRSLGIPTVAELLNLFVDKQVLPDVIVAPSLYALQHDSVQSSIQWSQSWSGWSPLGVIIRPSVDLNHFDSYYASSSSPSWNGDSSDSSRSPACRVFLETNRDNSPCFNFGFVARLSTSKNPGLFLQAAYLIAKENPFARFIMIGEGPIRADLEELAARLQIREKVDFRGFISYAALPAQLADIDVLINPSLRSWSETFCIVNIEAFAMEIPLITFAVGGIGEYVASPRWNESSSQSAVPEEWTLSANALVVHSATPSALADASQYLYHHHEMRKKLGQAARQALLATNLTLTRQMEEYTTLYEALYSVRSRVKATVNDVIVIRL